MSPRNDTRCHARLARFVLPFAIALSLMAQFAVAIPAAAAPVDPATVTATIPTGGTAPPINKVVHTPPIPPQPDIVFLADTTGSMGPALSNVKTNAATIFSSVRSTEVDSQFGVANYTDFNCTDPHPYQLNQPVTADLTAVQNGINAWTVGNGCDVPEGQINALYQLATDAATGFRSGSTRIIAWFGDSNGHDPSGGHTLADAIAALQAAHIRVIAVPVSTPFGNGLDNGGQASAITSATGGVLLPSAPPDQVANAIISGLQNLPVTVTPQLGACSAGLNVGLTPADRTVTSGQDAGFTETIGVAANAPFGTTLTCTVNFLLNGKLTAGFSESITINVPKHDTKLVLGGATTSDYHDAATLSATLTDAVLGTPVGGAPLTLSIDGQNCAATTLASGVGSCEITPNEPAGSYPLTAAFAGNAQYNPSSATGTFIVTLEETTLAITSSNTLATGAVNVSAVLKEDGATPISGRTVTFSAGGVSANGTTNGAGVASATLALAPGAYTLNANFAGDTFYKPSAAAAQTLYVFQPTQFVIWGGNAPNLADAVKVGQDYNFWGAQWEKQVTAGDYQSNGSFKGYADQVSGATWTSRPGDASNPPGSVATHISVIVATHVAKDGSVESGNIVETVVLKVDNPAAYQPNPGHPGSGVMVAVVH